METMEVAPLPMSPATMVSAMSRLPSAYTSAPGSPTRFEHPANCGFYASAPASPSRVSAAVFRDLSDWEHANSVSDDDIIDSEPFDFANGFSGQLDKEGRLDVPDLATADELFEQGMIRPLNSQAERGRVSAASNSDVVSSRYRRGSRSLSPMRGAAADKEYFAQAPASLQSAAASAADSSLVKGGSGSKKWRLMDMLLFRSASEGRATGRRSKDPLCRFSISCSPSSSSSSSSSSFLPSLFRKRKTAAQEDASNVGSRSGGSKRGGRSASSAHAMHLTASRAASEETRKKAPLPYHQNTLFGGLRYSPAIQSLSRQFSSSHSSPR